ncbi:SWIM zinc finger family protein [Bdellovibrionota bacterium FG-1]
MARGGYYGGWAPYVSVAERRKQAEKKVAGLRKKGKACNPVHIEGRAIARTFWGKAWCNNLEAYSDFSNRLPRGRTYVRNGSVIDLQVGKGEVLAMVSGSSIYTVKISIRALEKKRWKAVIDHCSGKIDSLVELLQGKLSQGVMEVITCPQRGLFPAPEQIDLDCSCPDGAMMCKHVAAVLYGVGARLDEKPELFFELRNVDHADLITAASAASVSTRAARPKKAIQSGDLSALFGIELEAAAPAPEEKVKIRKKKVKKSKCP